MLAYILIQTEQGAASMIVPELSRLAGVLSAESLLGPYDLIVKAQAETIEELSSLVIARIQAVTGVTRTLTCHVVNFP